MSKLSRNQIIAILVFGVVLLAGALVILSNRQSTEPQIATVTDEAATSVAQAATEEPQTEPAPLPTGQRRDDVEEPPVEEPPSDKDGDGIPDDQDACPDQGDQGFGIDSSGCPLPPPPPSDRDGDGIIDDNDACPDQGDQGFGLGSDGCPLPPPPPPPPPTEEVSQVQGQEQQVTRSCAIGQPSINGNTYTFTVTNIENVSVFEWDLAGIAASGATVSRDFTQPGNYTITLVCSDGQGNQLPAVIATVDISEVVTSELACAITGTPSGNTLPVTVTWAVTGVVGDLDTFNWDFGGGDVATGASVQRTYSTAGIYNVTLTCSGAGGTVGPLSGSVDISSATSSASSLAANFTINVAGGAFPQNAILTSNVTGTHAPFTYAWVVTGPSGFSFTSSDANPSFQLPAAGLYNIELTVRDSASPQNSVIARGSINATEDIAAPVITINAAPLSGASPLDVTFSAVNTGGPISTYSWNFAGGVVQSGDVNGAGPIVVRFTGFSGQRFNVTLDVTGPDGDGASALRQVVITGQGTSVTARFTYSNQGNVDDLVRMCFTSTSTGNISAYEWDFNNDGTVDSTDQNPCFNFAAGQHIVNLLVRGPGGETSSSQQLISVARGAEAPIASFTVAKTTVNANENVTPVNTSTGEITSYEWSFGDGSTSTAQNPTHKYLSAGTYVINLKVTGPGGSSEAAAVEVTVVYAAVTCPISGSTTATYGNNNFSVSLDSNQLADRSATVQWLVGGEVVGTGNSYTRSFTEAGQTVITVQVLIDGVVVCQGTRTVSLTLNTVSCPISGSTSVLLNQSITYSTGTVTNLNGRTVTSRLWELISGGVTITSATTTSFAYQFTSSGSYTVKMTITLSDGTSCIRETTVTVSEQAFTCTFDRFPSSATQYISNEYRVAVTGNSSGGTLSYKWYVDGVEVIRNNRSLTYAHNESGQKTMKVEVYFNGNLVCTVERGVGVGVGSTDFCSVTGTFSAYLNQNLTYNLNIDNSKLGSRTVAGVEWFINGTSVQDTGAFSFTNRWSAGGSYELKVIATANTGEACIVIRTVTVNENELVCNANMDGNSTASQFQTRTYSIATSPSGVANVSYEWFVNDVLQSGNASSFTYRFTEANSSVTMKVKVYLNGVLVCEKTRTVSVSGDPLSCNITGPDANSILIGESYRFDVNLTGANGRSMSYAWFLDDTQISTSKAFNYTFNQTTPQTLRLVATPTLNGQPAGDPCERSFSFTARAAQSISAEANPNVVRIGGSVTFTAITESITRSTLTWFYPNGTSQNSEVGTFTFNQAGTFEIFVEGVGVIRTQRASVVVTVIDYSEINVTFIANPWEALAPREICFVPSTDIDETLITEWLWTFHDGTTSTDKFPCKQYDTPGEYNVKLDVTDGLLRATSTNKVRLYEVIDANATFNVTPKGGLEYCFLPQVSSGVVVSEFEFGDGASGTVTNNGEVCHTYQSEGNYIVRMKFSKDGQQGTVPRTVFITAGVSESFNATALCEFSAGQDRITYTITYLGQQMAQGASYAASYSVNGGTPVALGNVSGLSADNPNKVFQFSDRNAFRGATITLSVAGLGELTRVVDCWDRSSVSVDGVCLNGVITFYVTNTGSEPMTAPTTWRLVEMGQGNTIIGELESGTIQLAGNEVRTVTFNNPAYSTKTIRLYVDQRPGHPGFSQPNATVATCLSAPTVTVSGICEYGTGRALFTVNVGSAGANLPVTGWTATGASTTTGTVGPLNAGTSAQFAVLTGTNGSATFTVTGFDDATATVNDCYKLTLDTVCWENTTTHTMRVNNANTQNVNYTWEAGALNGNGTATPGQSTFSISGLQYGDTPTVNLYVGGILVASKTINSELCTPPVVTLNGVCAENGVFTFNITGTPFGTGNYSVSDGLRVIDSGTFTESKALRYENITATSLTLSISGTGLNVNPFTLSNCYTEPVYTPAGYCEANGVYGFTISHSGGLPIFGGVGFTVYEGDTVIDSGVLSHEEAIAFNKTYNSTTGALRLRLTWSVTQITARIAEHTQSNCYAAPQVTLNGYCEEENGNTTFSASLTGEPVGTFSYTVVDQDNNVIDSGDLSDLFNGKTYTGNYSSLTLSVTANGDPVTVSPKTVRNCYDAPRYVADGICVYESNGQFVFTASNEGGTPLNGEEATFVIVDENGATVASGNISDLAGLMPITGTYKSLTMTISTTEGTIQRQADTLTCYVAPKLVASAVCTENNAEFRFVVNNVGGTPINGTTLPNYSITDNNGTELQSGTVTLPFSETVISENQPLTITFSGGDADIEAQSITSTENCFNAPDFEPNVYCGESNGVFIISILNKGGRIVDTQPSYEIFIDGEGQGAVGFGNDDIPVNVTLPAGTYGNVKVVVTYGEAIVSADNSDCYEAPVWTPSAYCDESENGVFRFEVTRSGGDPVTGQEPTFTIVAVGNPPYSGAGNISELPKSITGRYSSVTLTLNTTEGSISAQAEELTTCYVAPVYVPEVVCSDVNGEFTVNVVNIGGEPVLSGVTILVDFAVINGGGVGADLIENASLPFTKVYLGEFQYVQVSVGSEDVPSVSAINEDCFNPPVYVPEIECSEANGIFLYGYTNIGGAPIPGISFVPYYRVFDQNGDTLAEGYADAPYSGSVVGPYSSVTLTLYTNIEGAEVVSTTNDLCYVPPVYEPTGYCDEVENGTFYFEIGNNGGEPLQSLPSYEIVDENDTVVASGSVTYLPFPIGPIVGEYGRLSLIITLGEEGEGSVTVDRYNQNCYRAPVYVPQLSCAGLDADGVIVGRVLNAGGTPLFSVATYQVVDNEGNVLAEGIISELPFELNPFTSFSRKVTLNVFVNGSTLSATAFTEGCYLPPDETPTPTPTPPPPGEPVCGETIETPDGRVLINLDMCDPDPELGVPEWEPVIVGAAICPDWLVFHTNRTGDWELFRLGDLPDGMTGPENLSRGIGPDVFDLAPSRSPDGMWIAFASTRDTEEGSRVKNWEIYIAHVNGEDTRRITYNSIAMDLDPVWAPNGLKLAYETTTDKGDWEIRVFDLLTGENTNITNHPSNDINPFWSPDGTKLLIQSDREDGLWQIYEIDLANGNAITKLSDGRGDDHDPMYSNDGTKIVFRSYRDDPRPETDRNRQSSVYYMNVDGSNVVRVSQLGGNATNHVFSPDDTLIAYQSTLANGINDIYVYEIETGLTRLLTNNQGERYQNVQNTSPTWYCESTMLVFTSDIDKDDANPFNLNLFMVNALPIDAPPINVDEDAVRLTDDTENDRDAQNSPSEENASRHGQVPPKWRP